MRVAYVCADAGVPVFGTKGCSVHVQEIVHEFLRRGNHVTLYALRTGGDNCFATAGLNVREFSLSGSTTTEARERSQIDAAERIAQQIFAANIDVVYERYSLWSEASLVRSRMLGIPSVLEVNAPLIEEQLTHRHLVDRDKAIAIRNNVFQAATTIVTVSDKVADYVCSCLPTEEHGKVHVIPNGVDVRRFHPDVSPHTPARNFTVGFLGTLKPWHGLESLLAAFHVVCSKKPHVRLCIIGDGPMRESLQSMVTKNYQSMESNIQWLGAVHPRDVPSHLTSLNVAVAPYLESSDFYFSPLKVYEYMAAGRAVVASSVGQLPEALEYGNAGLLYPPGDVDALAERLLQLIEQPQLCLQLGVAARGAAVRKHSWQQTLNTILQHLSSDHESDCSASLVQRSDRRHESKAIQL